MEKPLQVLTVLAAITIFTIILTPMTVSAYTVDPALITTVQNYIDTSKTQVSQEKWTRALAGLGGISHADPMTAQEAQINAYKFDPNRWNPVIEAMVTLQGVTVDKPAALVSAVQDYAVEAHVGSEHVDRWNRVLAALGSGTHDSPMTAAEAQTYADRGWKRWIPVVDTLTVLELQPQAAPQTEQAGQPPQWGQPPDPPQNAQQAPTRQERIAEAKQIIQEMKSLVAELRQDLDEAKAFVNTLDNKAPYTGSLAITESVLLSLEEVITRAENELSIMGTGSYEFEFQEIVRLYNLVHTAYTPAINEQLPPILFVKEATIQMQELREIRSQAHAMMADAKEFVKKWDETPTSYAKAIEQAEYNFRFVSTVHLESNYEKLLNKPTSATFQQAMQGYYRSITSNFEIMEDALETLLSTARQPTVQEQCDRTDVTCEFYTGTNYMTRSQFDYTDSDGIRTVIDYWPSGDIKQYTSYFPHSIHKDFEVKYYDPTGGTACNPGGNGKQCVDLEQDKTWYSDGTLWVENRYHGNSLDGQLSYQAVYRTDGTSVYNYAQITINSGATVNNIDPDTVTTGTISYKDGSLKVRLSGGTDTCYEDGAGNSAGQIETCTAAHYILEY